MIKKTLSVLIPNYNHGKIIARAIEAIVSQSRLPDEIIILDDGSSDNSWEILQNIQKQHPLIKLMRHPKNLGLMASVKDLVNAAKSEYIWNTAADDHALPGFFERAMKVIDENEGISVVAGNFLHIRGKDGSLINRAAPFNIEQDRYISADFFFKDWMQVLGSSFGLSPGAIYRREAFISVGGYMPLLSHFSDVFLMYTSGLRYGIYYINHDCAAFYDWEGSYHHLAQTNLQEVAKLISAMRKIVHMKQFNDILNEEIGNWWVNEYERVSVGNYKMFVWIKHHEAGQAKFEAGTGILFLINKLIWKIEGSIYKLFLDPWTNFSFKNYCRKNTVSEKEAEQCYLYFGELSRHNLL